MVDQRIICFYSSSTGSALLYPIALNLSCLCLLLSLSILSSDYLEFSKGLYQRKNKVLSTSEASYSATIMTVTL